MDRAAQSTVAPWLQGSRNVEILKEPVKMNTLRSMSVAVAVLILVVGAACVNEPSNTTDNRATPANTNAISAPATPPAPGPAAASNAEPSTQPVTLAVLDAFFALENFAADLQAKLQLTDEQVNKLRSIARLETSKLLESDNHDAYAADNCGPRGSVRKSKAGNRRRKTQALIAFINERWSGDVPATAGVTPAQRLEAVGVPRTRASSSTHQPFEWICLKTEN
jgi:hypothetical protein